MQSFPLACRASPSRLPSAGAFVSAGMPASAASDARIRICVGQQKQGMGACGTDAGRRQRTLHAQAMGCAFHAASALWYASP